MRRSIVWACLAAVGLSGQAFSEVATQQKSTVQDAEALALRLHFENLDSFQGVLFIENAKGTTYKISGEGLKAFHKSTPYFNGSRLSVYTQGGELQYSVEARYATVGKAETICDSDDTRTLSQKPFVSRMLTSTAGDAPCSGTLISRSCGISAGHCVSYLKVGEFNTPPSVDGDLVHAEATDQYVVDQASLVSVNRGVGNDWAVYRFEKNPITGLYPAEAQNGYQEVSFDTVNVGDMLRITGYGVDTEPETRFAQQTSFGPIHALGTSSDAFLKYRSDTTGGSSGSGVIHLDTEKMVAVHTHGGCNDDVDSANQGTAISLHQAFADAIKACIAGDM